jgi:uncharacterized protein YndB with AHSA1/START domain
MELLTSYTSPDQTSLQVRGLFAAPRERVFRAWIDREALQQWLRPGGVEVTVSHLDAHMGGGFEFETKAADGRRGVTTGKYLEVSFPEKLVFTWASSAIQDQETLVTVEFIERGGSTEIILTHDRFAGGANITMYQNGWASMLDRLASVVSETA